MNLDVCILSYTFCKQTHQILKNKLFKLRKNKKATQNANHAIAQKKTLGDQLNLMVKRAFYFREKSKKSRNKYLFLRVVKLIYRSTKIQFQQGVIYLKAEGLSNL